MESFESIMQEREKNHLNWKHLGEEKKQIEMTIHIMQCLLPA